ncbi:amidohydrolase/deacetylase family metallohydrolase [Saccharibacillus sp. CPCC 101409]|uniref:amidohydrolase/deacetylase family metallohydrolase n=1 Tax=Saccharibacillus sp. CPCC 101409 TaxID=3058041 RepID=UPI002672F1E9|nr:amidohydrolase/deacetylase family metallohydrolase [Saccharibacillus sp. CPCC 101409]MDO3413162.1 amidohydrolase/deacetylase family metallohydrolase [Saccharibacillus sp. CPCC 101409]
MKQDFLLRGVIFPDGETADLEIRDGLIAGIHSSGAAAGGEVVDCGGLHVSSGWIDMHVHAFPEFEPYGDSVDAIGVDCGVTTIVDAGSCGADRIGELAASAENASTRLLAFLNISRIGLQRTDELSKLDWIDRDAAVRAAREHAGFVVGLKARISRSVVLGNGTEPLRRAVALAEELKLPIMTHIGSGPPPIEEVMPLLRQGDIVTHYLNGKANNLFDEQGRPLPVLVDAIKRGVRLDVGHGTASFSFETAEQAKAAGISFDTISTDIYRGNRLNGPVYGMDSVLTKFLTLGYPLKDVVEAVTVRPAAWLNRPELGRIRVGEPANLTLFSLEDVPSVLTDSEGVTRTSKQTLKAEGVVVNGQYLACQVRA